MGAGYSSRGHESELAHGLELIGRYEILGRIGSGGFATVYRAHDPVLDSDVAVKVLADNWAGNDEIRDRFIREAQLLRRIDSDRVVTVHDIGELPSGQPYFVMALADRGTMDGRLGSQTPALHDVMVVARGMAECITVVHSHGLIHRDIKPGNLLIAAPRSGSETMPAPGQLLAPAERLVLGDFGLAKDLELQNTGLTIAAGSGGYAAPEQMVLAGTPSRRTDLFAATAVMYRVVSGSRPPSFDLGQRGIPFPDGDWWMAGTLGAFFRVGMSYEPTGRHDSIDHWLAEFTAAMAPFDTPTAHPARPAPPVAAPSEPEQSGRYTARVAETAIPDTGILNTAVESGADQIPAVSTRGEWGPGQGSSGAAAGLDMSGPPSGPTRPVGLSGSPSLPAPPLGYAPPATGQPAPAPYPAPPSQSFPVTGSGEPPSGTHSRRWFLGGAAATLLAVGGGGAVYLRSRKDGPTIEGLGQVQAGSLVPYAAVYPGAETFEWTDPGGSIHVGPTFELPAVLPGSLRFSVRARLPGGEKSGSTSYTLLVTQAALGPEIVGPDEVAVDDVGLYSYTYDGASSNPVWIEPGGAEQSGEQFRVTPTAPGRYLIRLRVDRPDGPQIGASREIRFV